MATKFVIETVHGVRQEITLSGLTAAAASDKPQGFKSTPSSEQADRSVEE